MKFTKPVCLQADIKRIVMRKTFYFAAIILFILSSCSKDDETLTNQPVRTQAGPISSGGISFNNILRLSLIGESLDNSCMREAITITAGNLIIDVHGLYNENNSTIFVNTNMESVTAKGRSGMQYALSGSFNEQTSEFSNGVFTTRLQHFDRWIGSGSSNIAIVKSTYFIKVDAAGNVRLFREPVSEVYCR